MPRPRFDLADRLEHQAGNVENDGHLNAARYMREAAAVLRADDDTLYIRADIVERMAEAASETLAKFDACRDSAVRNTPLGLTKLRSALNSYREASNEQA